LKSRQGMCVLAQRMLLTIMNYEKSEASRFGTRFIGRDQVMT
jgi:hypothetical protein